MTKSGRIRIPRSPARFVATLLSVVALGTACGNSSTAAGPASPTVTVTASSPVPTETPSPSPSTEPTPTPSSSTPIPAPTGLVEGRDNFGFIKSVDVGSHTLVFDLAQLLTGDAAIQAAIEDGVIEPGEVLNNDYYIRNRNTLLRTVPFVPDVDIELVDWANCCETPKTGDLEAFAEGFASPDAVYHGGLSPYWLTVHDGTIEKIEEQYIA